AGSCGFLTRDELEDMARAAQQPGETPALDETQAAAEEHVAGIEQPHRLVAQNGEPIGSKVTTPPIGVKQPQLGQYVATLAVPTRKQTSADGTRCSVPGLTKTLKLRFPRDRTRQKVRHAENDVKDRVGIA